MKFELDTVLSLPFRVKYHGVIGLATYGFLLMVNSNIGPNLTTVPLRDIKLWNQTDPDFDLSKSFNVKCDGVIELPIYGLLLM